MGGTYAIDVLVAERQLARNQVGATSARFVSFAARVFIAALLSVIWYVGLAWLSRYAGTCTTGDVDRFVAGVLVGVPAGVAAVVLLLKWEPRTRWAMASLLAPLLLAFVPMVLYARLAISAGVGGHHLCGPAFNDYLSASYTWERFIPLVHVVLGAAIALAAGIKVSQGRTIADITRGSIT